MANVPPPRPSAPLQSALAEAKNTAKEQLQAASQLQLDRLTEEFSAGWRQHIEQIFEERLGELALRIEAHLRGQFEGERAHLQSTARREATGRLSQAARRLRVFQHEAAWSRALVESTEGFCQRSALFALNQGSLEFRAGRNLKAPGGQPVPLAAAPAFAAVVDTRDTVVALRTSQELSENIADLAGEVGPAASNDRCYLFPLCTRERVAAILYADSPGSQEAIEVSALELLATLGGSVLDGLGAGGKQPSHLLRLSLNKDDDDLHLRAQRFARVKVAEMRLYQSEAVKEGRAHRDLYVRLKHEIDSGREAFGHDFLEASPSMSDYFHLELIRTLANDDASLLGSEYPGPMA